MTVKTLRHYHQIGLLEPAEVDPYTGYRRYAIDQIPAAQVIHRFRDLGMPLEQIQAVLSAPDLRAATSGSPPICAAWKKNSARSRPPPPPCATCWPHPHRATSPPASSCAPCLRSRRPRSPTWSTGRVTSTLIPAAELAVIEQCRAPGDVDRAYGILAAYVARHALAVAGPIREYYLVGQHDTPDTAQWRTEIGWPIFQTSSA